MPHPNADRLTLLRVDDGSGTEQIVLTGAPNLFHLKGTGPLPKPLKIVYAREGAVLFDGHKPGREVMTLKRTKIRGVESKSMVCSEKELGISDEHDGIILLDDDAPVGRRGGGLHGRRRVRGQDQPEHGAQRLRAGHRARDRRADRRAAAGRRP